MSEHDMAFLALKSDDITLTVSYANNAAKLSIFPEYATVTPKAFCVKSVDDLNNLISKLTLIRRFWESE